MFIKLQKLFWHGIKAALFDSTTIQLYFYFGFILKHNIGTEHFSI